MTHCVPVLVAVIIANFVAGMLQPSVYDSIILIKKLPYLPDIIPSSTEAYNIFVESFMVKVTENIINPLRRNVVIIISGESGGAFEAQCCSSSFLQRNLFRLSFFVLTPTYLK